MASGYELFDPFNYIQPGPFISKYSDWITFTLLLVFFVSVAGIALHRHFQENRYLKPLIISVGLILTVGTYYAIFKGWLHLSFQGFGFLGAFLLFIIIFFIAYSLVRAFGVQRSSAISIGYALLYTSLWVASPNIFDTIANRLPIINLVLLILFITSIFKFISAFFRHTKSPLVAAKELSNVPLVAPPSTETDNEIQKELSDDRKERKLIKKKTIKTTKLEIGSVDNMKNTLEEMITKIRENGNRVDEQEIEQLTHNLRQIYSKENILRHSLEVIQRHVKAYNALHRKNIQEIKKRLEETKDNKQRNILTEEIQYQKKMLQIIDFLRTHESKITEFVQTFNRLIYTAMTKVKSQCPSDALSYLEHAKQSLFQIRHIYEKQKQFEEYLLRLNRKTIGNLKKEKKTYSPSRL